MKSLHINKVLENSDPISLFGFLESGTGGSRGFTTTMPFVTMNHIVQLHREVGEENAAGRKKAAFTN